MNLRNTSGLTLIELLVALTLAAFIFTVGVLSLRTYMATYQKHKKLYSELTRNALFCYLFFKQLQNIPDRVFGKPPLFEGEADHLTFITTTPITGSGFPGPRVVELRIYRQLLLEREITLYNRESYSDYQKNIIAEPPWHIVYRVPTTGELSFAYYDGRDWSNRWDKNGYPNYIALSVGGNRIFVFPVRYYR